MMTNIQPIAASLSKPIVLVGMMGCGKSVVGALLAKALNVPFIDADSWIEEKEKMTISQIFEMHGEVYFRQCEDRAIRTLLASGGKVVAVGGGAFIQESLQKYIKDHAVSVWIYADYETLLERLSRKNHRPLLERGNKEAIIKELMELRYPIYAKADIRVDTTTGAHEVVVERIIQQLKNVRRL